MQQKELNLQELKKTNPNIQELLKKFNQTSEEALGMFVRDIPNSKQDSEFNGEYAPQPSSNESFNSQSYIEKVSEFLGNKFTSTAKEIFLDNYRQDFQSIATKIFMSLLTFDLKDSLVKSHNTSDVKTKFITSEGNIEIQSSATNFYVKDSESGNEYLLPGTLEVALVLGEKNKDNQLKEIKTSNSLLEKMLPNYQALRPSNLKKFAGEYAMEQLKNQQAIEQPKGDIKCQLAKDFSDFLLKAMQEVFKSDIDQSEKSKKIGNLMLLKFRSDAIAYSGQNQSKLKNIKIDFKKNFSDIYQKYEINSGNKEISLIDFFSGDKINLEKFAFALQVHQIEKPDFFEIADKISKCIPASGQTADIYEPLWKAHDAFNSSSQKIDALNQIKIFIKHIDKSITQINQLKGYSETQKTGVVQQLSQLKQETQKQVIAAGTGGCGEKINESVKKYQGIIQKAARQEPAQENFFYKLIHKILNKFSKNKAEGKESKQNKSDQSEKNKSVLLSNSRYWFLGEQKKLNQLQEKLPETLQSSSKKI